MSDVPIGQLIMSKNEQRDAIHVAIFPIEASEDLEPGERICVDDTGKACRVGIVLGIVDPFLTEKVRARQRFWMFLLPNTVNGMRHHWSHKAFPSDFSSGGEVNDKAASEKWLMNAAHSLGVSYDEMISEYSSLVCGDYINNGEHIRDIWYEIEKDYWYHRKVVTGVDIDERNKGGFTCSC